MATATRFKALRRLVDLIVSNKKKLRLSNLAKPLTSASFHAMETDKNLKAMEI